MEDTDNNVIMGNIIGPTQHERRVPNVLDVYTELKALGVISDGLRGALRSIGTQINDPRYTAEFQRFFEKSEALRQVAQKHSWTRATISSVARATVGAGFSFIRHPVYGMHVKMSPQEVTKVLMPVYDFFYGMNNDDRYIQDTYGLPQKIYYTVVSLVYYGQAAWEIIRDEGGRPISFDVLPGIVRPNIDSKGKFLRPAYYFRPWNSQEIIEYRKPDDLLYIIWPGVDFSVWGSSEYDAVADVSIPSDLYASMAYRNHFENINSPYNGYWVVDKDTDDDDYRAFLESLINRYSGVGNYGRNPIVIRGDADFKETRSRSNDDAPYLEGRRYNQEELSAVTAVPSAKLGLADNTTKTNFREQRRDFHENTLRPVFEIIEDAIYRQILVKGFDIKEFKLAFNSPDLTTALEAATINTRYILNGVLNPNEVRQTLGYPDRDDEYGKMFYAPTTTVPTNQMGGQEGIAKDDADTQPENSSNRQFDNVRPPTQDRAHTGNEAFPESQRGFISNGYGFDSDNVINELKAWKNFAIRVATGKRPDRAFHTHYIPENITKYISGCLTAIGNNEKGIEVLFDTVSDVISKSAIESVADLTNLHNYGIEESHIGESGND